MDNNMLTLAFSVQSSKGAYAVLLGSGISKPADIPTGWEITLDLIRKTAQLCGENCEPEPDKWFEVKFGIAAGYDAVVEKLCVTPADRSSLLRPYIEPTEDERAEGLKQPTKAHKAIAELAKKGHIRVIVTTNFDKLMENALAAEGVTPTIITTASDIAHTIPLTHASCTIIKVHGDYMQPDTRNIASELTDYEPEMDSLLDRVFDEYGLIVSGWSASWDVALCKALKRCKTHRYGAFWAKRGSLSPQAEDVIKHRWAKVIPVADADTFFVELGEKVTALEDLAKPTTLSTQAAVATLKRYLPDPTQRIRLHDLVQNETNRTVESLHRIHQIKSIAPEQLIPLLERYDSAMETLEALIIEGSRWGENNFTEMITETIKHLIVRNGSADSINLFSSWKLYPAMRLRYVAGMASLIGKNTGRLVQLLVQTIESNPKTLRHNLTTILHPNNVLPKDVLNIARDEDSPYPVGELLYEGMRETFSTFVDNEYDYTRYFDIFEYWQGLIYADLTSKIDGRMVAIGGRFAYRYDMEEIPLFVMEILEDAERMNNQWPPFKFGLFGGSIERFREIQQEYNKLVVANTSSI